MKLAELLKERSALQDRADDLAQRVYDNARLVEGDTPSEDPAKLIEEIDHCYAELERVVSRINHANSSARGPEGDSLADLLLRRELLGRRLHVRKQAADRASKRNEFRDQGVLHKRHVDVSQLRKEADELGKQYRELDNQIQSLNWLVTVEA